MIWTLEMFQQSQKYFSVLFRETDTKRITLNSLYYIAVGFLHSISQSSDNRN